MTDSIDAIELSNLKEIMEDEFELLINMYLEDTEKMIQQMAEAIENQDLEALKMASHTLKGSSSNMFVIGISQLSKEVEDKAKTNELEAALNLIPQLKQEYQMVKKRLKAF